MKNPLKSKRFRPVPEPDPVPPHLTGMGWGPPTDDASSFPFDPADAERSARRDGARALAELRERDLERRREQRDAELAGVRRGINYSEAQRR